MPPAAPEFRVAQHDLRSVRVDVGAVRFVLRYGFSFDGNERLPESVALDGEEVTAFFLSSTVRDRIVATPEGFDVHRRWAVLQSGAARLLLTIDIPDAPAGGARVGARPAPTRSFRYLFPGTAAGGRPEEAGCMYRSERSCIPACLLVAAEDVGVAVWAEPVRDGRSLGVGLLRAADDSSGLTRLVFETPARERRPAPGFGLIAPLQDPGDGSEGDLVVSGKLEGELLVHVATGAPASICEPVVRSLLARAPSRREGRGWALRDDLRRLLATHLVDRGGVCGLRVTSGSDLLSSWASVEVAALLVRLAPRDAALLETAQRLGDFVLGAQHASGLFYGRYSVRDRSWVGLRDAVPGRGGNPPELSMEESSRVASALFDLEQRLAALGLEASRYGLAARRMVDAFFDRRGHFAVPGSVMAPDRSAALEEGVGAVRFLHPLLEVMARDRRERYRKAAGAMVARFLEVPLAPLELPASRPGREPDSRAVLLLLEALLEARARKLPVKGAAALAGSLLPWLYLGLEPERGPIGGGGAVADSLGRARWKPRPAQVAWLCEHLAPLMKGGGGELYRRIAASARGAAGSLPLGCSFVARARWPVEAGGRGERRRQRPGADEVEGGFVVGPVDARDFAVELGYAARLEEEGSW